MTSSPRSRWVPRWWRGRSAVIGIPYAWLLLFFLAPFLIVAKYSVSEMGDIHVQDIVSVTDGVVKFSVKYANYVFIASDSLYLHAYVASLKYALCTTFFCLLIGYPFAYFMARAKASLQPLLLMLVMLPFWTSFLLRVYAWKGLLEAASDLGATPWVAFWRVTVPLSFAGIVAGSMLVFIPCVGEYVTPELLGGPQTLMIGRVIWDENFSNNDPPVAATVAVVLVLLIVVPLALFNRYQAETREKRQ